MSAIAEENAKPRDRIIAQMRSNGAKLGEIAAACGVSKGVISGRIWRMGLPPVERKGGTPTATQEQVAAFTEAYTTGKTFDQIQPIINALPGRRISNQRQIVAWAKRLGLKRPADFWIKVGTASAKSRWKDHIPAEPKRSATPVPHVDRRKAIPLREVIRYAGELGLPRRLAMDVHAVSRAMKQADPSHPGFRLTTNIPGIWPPAGSTQR